MFLFTGGNILHRGYPLHHERNDGKILLVLGREIQGYDKNWDLEEER